MKNYQLFLILIVSILLFSACSTTKVQKFGCPGFTQNHNEDKLLNKEEVSQEEEQSCLQIHQTQHTQTQKNQQL